MELTPPDAIIGAELSDDICSYNLELTPEKVPSLEMSVDITE